MGCKWIWNLPSVFSVNHACVQKRQSGEVLEAGRVCVGLGVPRCLLSLFSTFAGSLFYLLRALQSIPRSTHVCVPTHKHANRHGNMADAENTMFQLERVLALAFSSSVT